MGGHQTILILTQRQARFFFLLIHGSSASCCDHDRSLHLKLCTQIKGHVRMRSLLSFSSFLSEKQSVISNIPTPKFMSLILLARGTDFIDILRKITIVILIRL